MRKINPALKKQLEQLKKELQTPQARLNRRELEFKKEAERYWNEKGSK